LRINIYPNFFSAEIEFCKIDPWPTLTVRPVLLWHSWLLLWPLLVFDGLRVFLLWPLLLL
jgi:hypothetical protein